MFVYEIREGLLHAFKFLALYNMHNHQKKVMYSMASGDIVYLIIINKNNFEHIQETLTSMIPTVVFDIVATENLKSCPFVYT